jgi:phytoene/squalene synthetase
MKPDFHEILTNPILDIAARFWDDERYDAFKICYRSMRVVDDLIDNRKATGHRISKVERRQFTSMLNDLVEAIGGATPCDSSTKELIETRARFLIPLWPWQRLSKSMIYDLHHDGFRTFPIFLRYSEGAAIAPASVFMHLCGVAKENGCYLAPQFDIRKVARPLALFAYLVHIIRDFQKDQHNNLNYLADALIVENGLNRQKLREIADGGNITPGFRKLMGKYYNFAEYYRRKARWAIDKTGVYLEQRYIISLEVIYNLYLQIFERIDLQRGGFTTAELSPSPEEVQNRVSLTISSFI